MPLFRDRAHGSMASADADQGPVIIFRPVSGNRAPVSRSPRRSADRRCRPSHWLFVVPSSRTAIASPAESGVTSSPSRCQTEGGPVLTAQSHPPAKSRSTIRCNSHHGLAGWFVRIPNRFALLGLIDRRAQSRARCFGVSDRSAELACVSPDISLWTLPVERAGSRHLRQRTPDLHRREHRSTPVDRAGPCVRGCSGGRLPGHVRD